MPTPARPAWRLAAGAAAVAALAAAAVPPAAAAANREPFAPSQWGIRQIGADAAWDLTRGRGARVGIIDTGVDLGHAEMSGRVVASTRCMGTGGQAARCGGSAQDDSGHGTHVVGIVGAPIDGLGVAGVAPEASLLVVKALRADGSGEATDVAAGIDWLLSRGVNVVNLSLAETLSPRRVQESSLDAAIRRAAAAGAVVVLAAGNSDGDASSTFNLPAIVVGATDRNRRLARYSQPLRSGIRWGLVAPGGDASAGVEGEVVSTYWFAGRRNSYAWSEGTSMAAPHVAGVAALLAAQGVKGQAAVDRLLSSASAATCGLGCRGLVDARAAVGASTPAAPAPQAAPNPPARVAPASPNPATPATAPTRAPAPTAPELVPARATPVEADPRTPLPDPAEVAIAPVTPAVQAPGRAPAPALRRELASQVGMAAVAAAVALLSVAAVTGICSWRRLRGDGEW